MSFLAEFWSFLKARRKFWLVPLLVMMFLLGGLLILAQSRRSRRSFTPSFRGPVRILRISAFYHDSAAALIRDGEVRAAAQEERFTHKKHDSAFPRNSLAWCLAEEGVGLGQIDHVVFTTSTL